MTTAVTPRSSSMPSASTASSRTSPRPSRQRISVNIERSAAVPVSGGAALIDGLDRGIGRALELSCAALVVTETLILFTGVIARYVLHRPLVWSDELASTLFLWLGMLGAALAIRRSENLRMN